MSLLNMHTWAPRDIRKLIVTYLDTMSRAMVLCAHGMRWMWLIQNACAEYDSRWDFRWVPGHFRHYHPYIFMSNKGVRKHKYMIEHASVNVLEWLQSENACTPSLGMIGYAIACTPCRIDVAQWVCIKINTSWDDIAINNPNMPLYVFRNDIPAMLSFISLPDVPLAMFKPIGVAIIFGAIKIMRTLRSEIISPSIHHMMCEYASAHHGADHEIYRIVHGMTRVDYIIETLCVV